jgi:hypothetical protein
VARDKHQYEYKENKEGMFNIEAKMLSRLRNKEFALVHHSGLFS